MLDIMSSDTYIESFDVDVYPITLIKFILNKKRILGYFTRAGESNFEIRGPKYKLSNDGCVECEHRRRINPVYVCRQHTSIKRVMNADRVLFDRDTGLYFYKNEIFKMVGHRLVIVYCPHPRLIQGEITDIKVRRVKPITVEDELLVELPQYSRETFSSNSLNTKNVKCWFNDDFSLVTLPLNRNYADWCLVPNK